MLGDGSEECSESGVRNAECGIAEAGGKKIVLKSVKWC